MKNLKNKIFSFANLFFYFVYFFICFSSVSFPGEPSSLSGKYKDYNVILIILDALRPDHLSCYGYAKETSPNIDLLAQRGVIFTNAFSQSHNTLPSVASIFSSLYPPSHGMEHIFKDKFPDNVYTLAEILNIYGYNTVWLGHKYDPHSGMADGLLTGFEEQYNISSELSVGLKVYDWTINGSNKYHKTPFFLTIHSYLTHETFFPFNKFDNSYNTPNSFIDRLESLLIKKWEYMRYACENNPEELDIVFGNGWSKKNAKYFSQPYSQGNFWKIIYMQDLLVNRYRLLDYFRNKHINFILGSLNDIDIPFLLSLLDNSIHELDENFIGRGIAELKKINIYDKTIIIITADHGNEYREHGDIGHNYSIYDEVIRIPLIFYLPHLNKAVRINSLAQSIDIMPTVLDLLGIPLPHQAQGISLTGLIEKRPRAVVNDYIFVKSLDGSLAIRSQKWKLIRRSMGGTAGNNEFYNIQNDPLEKNNLINMEPGIADIFKVELEAKISSLPKYNEKNSEFIKEIDPQTRERIKKTGYW
ncbi:MAG: sulfatase [Candidatus Omnitrophota bacterium]